MLIRRKIYIKMITIGWIHKQYCNFYLSDLGVAEKMSEVMGLKDFSNETTFEVDDWQTNEWSSNLVWWQNLPTFVKVYNKT